MTSRPLQREACDDALTFYDQIANRYDDVTARDRRIEAVRTYVDAVVTSLEPESVLDVACGAGLYAVEFARRGIPVVGLDLSGKMLEKAKRTATAERLPATWVRSPMQNLTDAIGQQTFDLILCMGNSLPHLLSISDLQQTLRAFHHHLNAQGHLTLQLLNYEKTVGRGERMVGISKGAEGTEYIRFYDFDTPFLRFNVLRVEWHGTTPTHHLATTTLRPYRERELKHALTNAGFRDPMALGGLDMSPFEPGEDDVLVLTASRK